MSLGVRPVPASSRVTTLTTQEGLMELLVGFSFFVPRWRNRYLKLVFVTAVSITKKSGFVSKIKAVLWFALIN